MVHRRCGCRAPARMRLVAACCATAVPALLGLAAGMAAAQDFDPIVPPALLGGAATLLDRGLPDPAAAWSVESGITRWFGLEALATRQIAVCGGWHGVRAAFGVSQTGEPELGWTALAALRVVARRDRASPGLPGPPGPGAGYECGGGAWARAAPWLELHAAAPQIVCLAEAPPLARGLELGATARSSQSRAWLAVRSAPRGEAAPPDHEAGLALDLGACRAWALARDRPLRGGIGIVVSLRALTVAAAVESHPVLGSTTRLGIALRSGPAP